MPGSVRMGLSIVIIAAAVAIPARCHAEDNLPDASAADSRVELTDADLSEIRLSVLEARPMLAASAGIKHADAFRGWPPVIHANVIFHPHADSGGVKQAFQVSCERALPDGAWSCPRIGLRRYLTVPGQAWEVRLRADIDSDAARALIEATRETARHAPAVGTQAPEAAISVIAIEDYYLVTWGRADGEQLVSVQARLRDAGHARDPLAWDTAVVEDEE